MAWSYVIVVVAAASLVVTTLADCTCPSTIYRLAPICHAKTLCGPYVNYLNGSFANSCDITCNTTEHNGLACAATQCTCLPGYGQEPGGLPCSAKLGSVVAIDTSIVEYLPCDNATQIIRCGKAASACYIDSMDTAHCTCSGTSYLDITPANRFLPCAAESDLWRLCTPDETMTSCAVVSTSPYKSCVWSPVRNTYVHGTCPTTERETRVRACNQIEVAAFCADPLSSCRMISLFGTWHQFGMCSERANGCVTDFFLDRFVLSTNCTYAVSAQRRTVSWPTNIRRACTLHETLHSCTEACYMICEYLYDGLSTVCEYETKCNTVQLAKLYPRETLRVCGPFALSAIGWCSSYTILDGPSNCNDVSCTCSNGQVEADYCSSPYVALPCETDREAEIVCGHTASGCTKECYAGIGAQDCPLVDSCTCGSDPTEQHHCPYGNLRSPICRQNQTFCGPFTSHRERICEDFYCNEPCVCYAGTGNIATSNYSCTGYDVPCSSDESEDFCGVSPYVSYTCTKRCPFSYNQLPSLFTNDSKWWDLWKIGLATECAIIPDSCIEVAKPVEVQPCSLYLCGPGAFQCTQLCSGNVCQPPQCVCNSDSFKSSFFECDAQGNTTKCSTSEARRCHPYALEPLSTQCRAIRVVSPYNSKTELIEFLQDGSDVTGFTAQQLQYIYRDIECQCSDWLSTSVYPSGCDPPDLIDVDLACPVEDGERCFGIGKCLLSGCDCPTEWSGSNCSLCISESCLHECGHGEYSYFLERCICDAGWTGESCDAPVCSAISGSVCSGRGDCVDNSCVCQRGYIGPACETIETCRGEQPVNSLGCVDTAWACTSFAIGTWSGERCTVPFFDRTPICSHGTLRLIDHTIDCICDHGWLGLYCDIAVCQNGECSFSGEELTCTNLHAVVQHANASSRCGPHGIFDAVSDACACYFPWTGELCDTHDCAPFGTPTTNQATAPDDICRCEAPWAGIFCDVDPCQPHGTWSSVDYECVCENRYFFGERCHQSACQNGALYDSHTTTCVCTKGWTGVFCDEPVCSGNGDFNIYVDVCACTPPTTGSACTIHSCEAYENKTCECPLFTYNDLYPNATTACPAQCWHGSAQDNICICESPQWDGAGCQHRTSYIKPYQLQDGAWLAQVLIFSGIIAVVFLTNKDMLV